MDSKPSFSNLYFYFFLLLPFSCIAETPPKIPAKCLPPPPTVPVPVFPHDVDLIQFALNLEFTEAEFFLFATLGHGIDVVDPGLSQGGPPAIGAMKANLDPITHKYIEEFGYQEVGHVRAIKETVGGFPRPLIDLSPQNFAKIFDDAFGYHLYPPFNPYKSTIHYLLASYVIPYMGLVGYVGANPNIDGFQTKRLLAGLLGVEAGQDAIIRAFLYERAKEIVPPYNITVEVFTARISDLRNKLAMCGIKDEGLFVPLFLGAEQRTCSNIISANKDSLSYRRTPAEILRVVYGTGSEHKPGGFFPHGANGKIAKKLLATP